MFLIEVINTLDNHSDKFLTVNLKHIHYIHIPYLEIYFVSSPSQTIHIYIYIIQVKYIIDIETNVFVPRKNLKTQTTNNAQTKTAQHRHYKLYNQICIISIYVYIYNVYKKTKAL